MTKKRQMIMATVAFVVTVVGFVLTIVFWRFPWQPETRPALYSLRVQVVDPARTPLRGSTVRTSAGNEPHLLPDGWWEVQIPGAKVPKDGRVTVWAEHPEWAAAQAVVSLMPIQCRVWSFPSRRRAARWPEWFAALAGGAFQMLASQ